MAIRVIVDRVADMKPEDREGSTRDELAELPAKSRIGVLITRKDAFEADDWVQLAASFAARALGEVRKLKPEVCTATYALRVADRTLQIAEMLDVWDATPEVALDLEKQPEALAHGEGAAFVREGKKD